MTDMAPPNRPQSHDAASGHRCQPPTLGGMTNPLQPDWTCGVCGRMWRDMASGPVRWWAEIRGPSEVASSSNWTPPPSAVPERFRSTSVPRNLP